MMAILTVYMTFCFLFALGSSNTLQICDKNWSHYESRCFKLFNIELSWTDAEKTCLNEGGHLPSVHSSEENKFIGQLIKSNRAALIWLGGTNIDLGDTWLWSDGSKMGFKNWNAGEPNNARGNENCLQMQTDGERKWIDEPCARKIPFVCAKDSTQKYKC